MNLKKFFAGRIAGEQLVIFTRQLATMLDAGLPINRCLQILGRQNNKHFAAIILDVKARVEAGAQLSEAMHHHPRAWNTLYVNLIKAGETSGNLPAILTRLSIYLEKSQALRRQVLGAMTYPIAILGIATIVVVVMLWKVIPVFQNMFKDFGGGALPAPTQFVINLSEAVQHNIFLILGTICLIAVGIPAIVRTKRGQAVFDYVVLKLPLIGDILRKVAVARFGRTLSTLLSSGVQIIDALETAARTAGNTVIAATIDYARGKVMEGKNLSEPLAEKKVFPPMVIEMIQVGEETGQIDNMLTKVADFYEDEVDAAVSALTKLIEPIMMVFLGGVVGGLMISMYMPIFEMAGSIKGG